jgi:two-component system, chemotaxis family, protein-glutamate methylesterase/glutaminase
MGKNFFDMPLIEPKRNCHDIVAVGASAEGVEAVSELLSLLPGDLAAAVLVVLHRTPARQSNLQSVLSRKSLLRVVIPSEGDRL